MKTLIPCDFYAENTTRKKQKTGPPAWENQAGSPVFLPWRALGL